MSENEQKQEEQKIDNRPLRERDPAEWKARKLRRQGRKNQARVAAKRAGVKMGRWRGGVAFAKDGSKHCITVGNANAFEYKVIEGGAR